ncbi:MAG TPA: hypothetical protein VMU83_04480 [Hanamia sp.]|nr:hypothetical protein [Hanamia sp.]
MNRLGNDVFFTWITQNGYIESFLLDPVENGLTNPQNTSGRFYIRDRSNGHYFQVNEPARGGHWKSRVGLGYNVISNEVNGIKAQVTYFVPRNDNVLVMILDVTNTSGRNKTLDLFGQVEWNLGDPVKSYIRKGDGLGGSQFNLYKKAFFSNNAVIAKQENWRNTADCTPWPYTGFFSVDKPVTGWESIKSKFIGTGRRYDNPQEVRVGKCEDNNFWSMAEYPLGVLQNTLHIKNHETRTLVYTLGMARDSSELQKIIFKYRNIALAESSLKNLKNYYNDFVDNSVTVHTPDSNNDRIINVWTKYIWRQFWKKSLNNNAYGLGLWSYGLKGETIGTTPEQFLLPFDMSLLKNCVIHLLEQQVADTTQTDLFSSGEHTMIYRDLGLNAPPDFHKGKFKVPHEHQIYQLFSILYYLQETGDPEILDTVLPYLEGNKATVWEHIRTGITIALKGIDSRGLPKIPQGVGDWMDEFTKISEHGDAESEMLGAEICSILKGFSEIAGKTGHFSDSLRWTGFYNEIKSAINDLAWDGDWYIRAFSDESNPFLAVGSKSNEDGKIYLNAQSWPVLSGIASKKRATRSLDAVRKYLLSDYGPLIFYPAFTHYVGYIGTQSIYAPGYRNACIYLRPAGWAIAAACINDQSRLAYEMYNKASLVSRQNDIVDYKCEPYAYPENYVGPDDSLLKGKGEFQWNLGEGAAWMWASYVGSAHKLAGADFIIL